MISIKQIKKAKKTVISDIHAINSPDKDAQLRAINDFSQVAIAGVKAGACPCAVISAKINVAIIEKDLTAAVVGVVSLFVYELGDYELFIELSGLYDLMADVELIKELECAA